MLAAPTPKRFLAMSKCFYTVEHVADLITD